MIPYFLNLGGGHKFSEFACSDMSSVVLGDQTEEVYSSSGRMRVLYAVAFKSLLCTLILRLRKPRV